MKVTKYRSTKNAGRDIIVRNITISALLPGELFLSSDCGFLSRKEGAVYVLFRLELL